jgi:catechol 2,3-dioxygenase-like lactoylglutathione lyase family enzyme
VSSAPKAYVEHVAIRVRDIAWHIAFFAKVFGMTVFLVDGDKAAPKQVWTVGGIQLIGDPGMSDPVGCFGHIGVMAEDAAAIIHAALAYGGVTHAARGRHWLVLPDGIVVEVLQASPPAAVAEALAVNARC